jgi:hypothetical protein
MYSRVPTDFTLVSSRNFGILETVGTCYRASCCHRILLFTSPACSSVWKNADRLLDKILYALNTRSVGRFAITMLMAALLSSCSNVSPVGRKPSSMRMDHKSLAILEAIKPCATVGLEQATAMSSTCRHSRTTFPSIVPWQTLRSYVESSRVLLMCFSHRAPVSGCPYKALITDSTR